MFAANYFAPRYFAGRFFPKVGSVAIYIPAPGEAVLTLERERRTLFRGAETRVLKVANEKRTLRMARNV